MLFSDLMACSLLDSPLGFWECFEATPGLIDVFGEDNCCGNFKDFTASSATERSRDEEHYNILD